MAAVATRAGKRCRSHAGKGPTRCRGTPYRVGRGSDVIAPWDDAPLPAHEPSGVQCREGRLRVPLGRRDFLYVPCAHLLDLGLFRSGFAPSESCRPQVWPSSKTRRLATTLPWPGPQTSLTPPMLRARASRGDGSVGVPPPRRGVSRASGNSEPRARAAEGPGEGPPEVEPAPAFSLAQAFRRGHCERLRKRRATQMRLGALVSPSGRFMQRAQTRTARNFLGP
jgi:hypothetical protein